MVVVVHGLSASWSFGWCRQGMIISILAHFGVIQPTLTYTQSDVADGITVRVARGCVRACFIVVNVRYAFWRLSRACRGWMWCVCTGACVVQNFLVCFEMFVAALAHHKYYNFKVCSFSLTSMPCPRTRRKPCLLGHCVFLLCGIVDGVHSAWQEFKTSAAARLSFKKAIQELLPSDLKHDALKSFRKASVVVNVNPMLSASALTSMQRSPSLRGHLAGIDPTVGLPSMASSRALRTSTVSSRALLGALSEDANSDAKATASESS